MKYSTQYIKSIILIIFIGLLNLTTNAVQAQVTKEASYKKRFVANQSTTVDIINKYGDIQINTWDKDSVAISVNVKVTESTHAKAQSKIKEIQFDLSQSGNFIIANTIIQSEKKNMLISEFSKLKENIGLSDAAVEITMELSVPKVIALQIVNKFGNIYLEDFDGDLKLDLSNGKLKANKLNGYSNLRLNFADAIIDHLESGKLEVYYGKLNLGTSRNLRITSKTSDIVITEVGQLTTNSTRDTYRIRQITDFNTQSSFTDYDIVNFKQNTNIVMNFGDLSIGKIASNFGSITIESKAANIDLNFIQECNFNFDITANRPINLPIDTKMESTETIKADEKIVRYQGRAGGSVKTEKPRLIMKTLSGNINIIKR